MIEPFKVSKLSYWLDGFVTKAKHHGQLRLITHMSDMRQLYS